MLNLPSVDKALRIPFSTEGKNSLNTVTGSSRIGKAHREPPDGARRRGRGGENHLGASWCKADAKPF